MKRNPSVELMRIIACLIVLACHCNFLLVSNDVNPFFHKYITAMLCDGVAIFWMITGFFIFNNNSYKKLWLHFLTKVFVPMLLLYIVDLFFEDFLLSKCSLLESLSKGVHRIADYVFSIIQLKAPNSTLDHTWYVFAYLLVILIFPILKAFADYIKEDSIKEKVFMILSLVLWVANDALANNLIDFGFHGSNVIIPSSLLVIWGYIIYEHRDLFSKKIFRIISPVAFILVNLLRAFLSHLTETYDLGDYSNLNVWYSVFGLINAMLIVSFCLSTIKGDMISTGGKAICFIASFTYGIYLIHPLIQESALHLGFFDYLYALFGGMPSWAYFIIALLISALLSFIICFLICLILRPVKKLFGLLKKK